MTLRVSLSALACAAVVAAGCSSMGSGMGMMGSAPAKTADGALVGSTGMTLYTFDRDAAGSGKSVCNGQCATNWPPALVSDDAKASGPWTVVVRDDGLKQWAYKGKPVYAFAKDGKAGDKTGDGFMNGAWHVAKP